MRILKEGERKGHCPKCDSEFAYTEEDLRIEYNNNNKYGIVYECKYLTCPVCKAKLLESKKRPE
jgi:C4-type Zn-finger protein